MGIISKPREDLITEGSPYSQKDELVSLKYESPERPVILYFSNSSIERR